MNLYNEDCKETLKKINAESLDLVVTSPPYYNAKPYSQYNSVVSYMDEMEEVFTLVFEKLKKSRMCVINISPVLISRANRNSQSYRIPLPFYYVPMMEKIGYEFLEDIIWKKPDGAVPNRNGSFYRHRKPLAYKPNIVTEYILVFKKPAPFLLDKVLKNDSLVEDGYERNNVWEINPDTSNWHPAPFPSALVEKIVQYYSYEGDLVYDPFAGSGTTGKVCKKMGRQWIMSEINQSYCSKIINDISKL